MKTTLFVAGFNSRTRARDLAYEFERYGRLVRCDIPAPKSYSSKPYAFVEFENTRDAEDAFNEMHGRTIDGYTLSVQWARMSNIDNRRPQHHYNTNQNKSRSRSPYRRERSTSPRRGRSPPRYNNASPTRNRLRSRSRSPLASTNNFQRRRSYSPIDN
ncbi:hypothetical protein BDF21DRAFT_408969 [Thamnidium elegans]|uniref:RRM domain-containing protein n=1 Tax=Thamnidium elegans TaxID=101142 RepID=A0A8H7VYF1_9FUNG|nr:hypothetical protein INT48_004332 [Thamnidium elegans]KAI8094532.1 hypothetical protein BDF21DRAFT_408969 [Thamnidium elegans]